MTTWHARMTGAAILVLTTFAHAAPPQPAEMETALWGAAKWQMAHQEKFRPVEWEIAPLYDGLLAAGMATGKAAYVGEVVIAGRETRFALGRRLYHADDHAVGHAWLDLYLADKTVVERLTPTRAQLDRVIAEPELRPLEIGKPGPDGNRWTWCDALYMGPPTFARLYAATGDKKYLDFLDREWKYTYDILWDTDAKLFYRDSRFKTQTSANGKKVFWSRGNGWVVGGLALMLPMIPDDHPAKAFYIDTFKQMAAALVPLQRADGLWSPSLLDDKDPDLGETSGSAFFVYGLTWGVNSGLLDRATYAPVIEKGWAALLTRQLPSGQIGYVQQVGDRPGNVRPEDHHTYGTGAFLLAGSEILHGLQPDRARTLKQLLPDAERYADAALNPPLMPPATMPTDSLRPVSRIEPRVLERNAGWCWFQDERALVVGDKVVFGSVAGSNSDGSAGGDVKVTSIDLDTGVTERFTLAAKLNRDDHAAPALLKLRDDRLLAVYAGHGTDKLTRYRISTRPNDASAWGDEQHFAHEDSACYSNILAVRDAARPDETPTLYNFVRANGYNPNIISSADDGRTWSSLGKLLAWPDRPYLKYAGDGVAVHFIATDGHPRVFDNSLYYGVIRAGRVYDGDGKDIGPLGGEGLNDKSKLTKIFEGDAHNVAWPVDFGLTATGQPVLIFSVQKDGAAIKNEPAGGRCWDHRYLIARADDAGRWTIKPLAYAGSSLYAAEPDYTGLAALDPNDDTTVVVSADVHPVTGLPNVSTADGKRHYELFRGTTADAGQTWTWAALTENSTVDNLRPVIPADSKRRVILWTRGTLRTYTDYELDVVMLVEPRQ